MNRLPGFVRATVATLALGLSLRAAQLPPPPQNAPGASSATAVIFGRVVDGGTGRPVAGATISAASGAPVPQQIMTGPDGYFLVRGLGPGQVALRATAPGYLSSNGVDVNRAGGSSRPVTLGAGERVNNVVVRLWKAGAISGQLIDDRGDALEGIEISLLRVEPAGVRRKFSIQSSSATDDRGAFRFAALVPGDYAVCALFTRHIGTLKPPSGTDLQRFGNGSGAPSNSGSGFRIGDQVLISSSGSRNVDPAPDEDGHFSVFADGCFSGATTVATAQAIALGSGEERTGVNVTARLVPAARIFGSVTGPTGLVPGIGVHLLPAGSDDAILGNTIESASTMTDATGAFGFIGVPAGLYVVKVTYMPNDSPGVVLSQDITDRIRAAGGIVPQAPAQPPAGLRYPTLWAAVPVSVDSRDVQGLTLPLREGARVSGRLAFEGSAQRPTPQTLPRITVLMTAAAGDTVDAWTRPQGVINPDGTFETTGVVPGNYLMSLGTGVPGWRVKSISVNGRDASLDPIEAGSTDVTGVVITMTDRETLLSGNVHTRTGETDPDAAVIVFPVNPARWEYAASRQMTAARTSKAGAFTFSSLPADDYFVVAIDDRLNLRWQDPKMLTMLSGFATRVSLHDGDKRSVDLLTSSAR